MIGSQSMEVGSETHWFHYVANMKGSMDSEVVQCISNHYSAITRVVANLPPQQATQIAKNPNPHVFFPQLGIFATDYAVGSGLLQIRKSERTA